MDIRDDWSSTFFSGMFLEAIHIMFPPEWTRREAEGLRKHLPAPPGARVLDVPCGGGRLSLALAAQGYEVTGIDLIPELVEHSRREADRQGLAARFLACDMRELPFQGEFDAAFCMGNSFGYFDDEGNERFLRAARRALRPGGVFILNAPIVAEVAFTGFQANSWHEIGGIIGLRQGRYEPARSRWVTEYTLLRGAEVERKAAAYRIYTFAELTRLLREAGFVEVEGFASLEREPLALGSKDCVFIMRNGG